MNGYQLYSDILFSKAGALGIPLSGTFELTARCNLDCKMCYIHKRASDVAIRSREWNTQQWLELARECQQAGMLHLLLTGGEPFLRPDFREIYTGCRNLGLLVSINSNATLIDEDTVAFLASNPPTRMNITLYGASAETYGALCGDPAAFQRAVNAILSLKAAGITVKLNFSITPNNRQDADWVYSFAKEQGLPIQVASYMFPPIRACENGCFAADRMTPEEAAAAQMAYDKFRFTPEELTERLTQQIAGIKVPDPDADCQELPTERLHCRAGNSTFWITWDGCIRPCGMMTAPSLDVSIGKFSQAWDGIRAAREDIFIPAKCSSCEIAHACDQCAALCYAETGSFTGIPTYMCEKTKAYLAFAQKILNQNAK